MSSFFDNPRSNGHRGASASARRLRAKAPVQGQRLHRIVAVVILIGAMVGLFMGLRAGLQRTAIWLFADNPRYTIGAGGLDLQSSGRLDPLKLREYAEISEGMNLFAVDLSRVRSLLESVPQIKSVEIQRVLPGTLRVRASERTPIARVDTGSGIQFMVDGEGVVLAPGSKSLVLPLIRGVHQPGLSPGIRITAPEFIDALEAVALASRPEAQAQYAVAEIRMQHPDHLDVVLRSGTLVRVGRMEMEKRFQRLVDILKTSRQRGLRPQSIDLTLDKNIPVKPFESS